MGTEASVQLWATDAALAKRQIDSVFVEMRRIDALMSPYREDSELALINRSAYQKAHALGSEMLHLLQKSQYFFRLSDGSFDVSYASVGRLYDYRRGIQPDPERLQAARKCVGMDKLLLDKSAAQIRFQCDQTALDLGGIAKGYAVDRGIALLQQQGVEHAMVSAGGDSRLLGDRRGRPWVVGVRNPRSKEDDALRSLLRLPLDNVAVSTSGDYERFFFDGELRVHHILSPLSGRSVSEIQSVTVIGPDAVDTDALSTAVFVMGVQRGLALIERLPAFDAIVIGSDRRIHYSSQLQSAGANHDF